MTYQCAITSPAIDSGHRFTGRFLSKLGELECWIGERLGAEHADAQAKLLGPRIDAFRKALQRRPEIVKNPATVCDLLEQLAPYLEVRSVIAHASLATPTAPSDDTIYLFEIAATDRHRPWKARTVIRASECARLHVDLADIVNRLKQQTPKS